MADHGKIEGVDSFDDYENDQPDYFAARELSPAELKSAINAEYGKYATDSLVIQPTSATKAYVGAGIATAIAVGGVLVTALSDNVITPAEAITAAIAGLTALGAVFGGVYATTNEPK